MNDDFIVKTSITIDAPASKVWEALTNPDMIREYLFGTNVVTDWRVGSPITYKGVWQGKPYEDKGRVLQNEPEKLLVSTFWSSLSGQPDVPENYQTVRYELSPEEKGTQLTLIQDNNDSQEAADHSKSNWDMVLKSMKELIENS